MVKDFRVLVFGGQMNKKTNEAAALLWKAWMSGDQLDALPPMCRPHTVEEGYAVQDALVAASNDEVAGYKIAATSKAGQAHIGIDHPISGRLLQKRMLTNGVTATLDGNFMTVAEAEFVFEFKADMPVSNTPLDWQTVMESVGALYLGIEMPSSRFAHFASVGAPHLISETACAHWMVLGPEVRIDWRQRDLAEHPVRVLIDGECVVEGKGADALGDPRFALTWQVNQLMGRGIGIKAGQIVTTGVCGKPVPVAAGNHVVADFGDFGTAEVRLTA